LVPVAKEVIATSKYTKTAVTRALGISRASIYKKAKVLQMAFFKKRDDEIYLPIIRQVVDNRPTYGYKRITILVNRILKSRGELTINRKRVYRLMRMSGLTLPKSSEKRANHEGTGKVMTLHSNTRWCSDAFEIKYFNGEKVYVAFSLDCYDREAIHFVATTQPLTQSHIAELMIFSVDKRFPKGRAPRRIQWLTDRGSIYRAQLTRDTARTINLEPCYTAAYSPSSNGMAEAFVGTMKRDYVYTSDCYDADTVLKLLPGWFEDYNSQAPHSALKMMSPREFIDKNNCVN
jgi:putative transposase